MHHRRHPKPSPETRRQIDRKMLKQTKSRNPQTLPASQIGKPKPSKTESAAGKVAAPVTDNAVNMESTLKVATRPSQSRNTQTPSSPKPKKQQGTQVAKAESRNFHAGKSRNLKKTGKKLGLDLGNILKYRLITLKRYPGKGSHERGWKSRKAISPK